MKNDTYLWMVIVAVIAASPIFLLFVDSIWTKAFGAIWGLIGWFMGVYFINLTQEGDR